MGWFSSSKCPVSEEERAWLEEASGWLIEVFTGDYVSSVDIILPDDKFFPDTYLGREQDVRVLFQRVCSYLDIDPKTIRLEFYSNRGGTLSSSQLVYEENTQKTAAGYYQQRKRSPLIGIDTSQMRNPASVIATMVHELSHHILMEEEGLIPDEDGDHEYLTDLATIYLGFGVFTANSVFEFTQWRDTFSQGWQAQRKGYMTEEMYGYALAIFAKVRGEESPEWRKFLNTNVKHHFDSSARFIKNNGLNLSHVTDSPNSN